MTRGKTKRYSINYKLICGKEIKSRPRRKKMDENKLTKEDKEFIESVKKSDMTKEQKNKLEKLVKVNRQFMIRVLKEFKIKNKANRK